MPKVERLSQMYIFSYRQPKRVDKFKPHSLIKCEVFGLDSKLQIELNIGCRILDTGCLKFK